MNIIKKSGSHTISCKPHSASNAECEILKKIFKDYRSSKMSVEKGNGFIFFILFQNP